MSHYFIVSGQEFIMFGYRQIKEKIVIFNRNILRTLINPRDKATMVKTKGAKCVAEQGFKRIHNMYYIGLRVKYIALYYNMKQPTVSNIVRRLRRSNMKPVKKNMGPEPKLSARGMRLLQRYVLDNKFNLLRTMAVRFNDRTGLNMCKHTARRYISKLKMDCYIAVQQPFLSSKNIAARVLWVHANDGWTLAQWTNVMCTDESSFTVRSVGILYQRPKGASNLCKYGVDFLRVGAGH